MQLLYKQFMLDQFKYVEVFVSKPTEIVIRLVTEGSSSSKGSKSWVKITPTDLQSIAHLKKSILYFLTGSNENPLEFELTESENGVTRINGKVSNQEPYITIRYFHKSLNNEEFIGTRYGIILNAQECVQLFRELENVTSHIQHVLRYNQSVHILFDMIIDLIYQEAVKCYEQAEKLKSHPNSTNPFKSYVSKNYHTFTACVIPNLLAEVFLNYCTTHNISCTLSATEVSDCITGAIVEEKRNIIYEVCKKYTDSIMKSMLGE
jgi:hypothetical protein